LKSKGLGMKLREKSSHTLAIKNQGGKTIAANLIILRGSIRKKSIVAAVVTAAEAVEKTIEKIVSKEAGEIEVLKEGKITPRVRVNT
jgi:hypothetical protein